MYNLQQKGTSIYYVNHFWGVGRTKMCPKLSKSVQKCPKVSKSVQKVPKRSPTNYSKQKVQKMSWNAPRMSLKCPKNVPKMSQKCPKNVPKMSQKCPIDVPIMSPEMCLRNIWMPPKVQKHSRAQRTHEASWRLLQEGCGRKEAGRNGKY